MADELQTVLTMRDQMTAPLKKATEGIHKMNKEMQLVRKNQLNLIPGYKKLNTNVKEYGKGLGLTMTAASATVAVSAALLAGVAALSAGVVYGTAKILEMVAAETDWSTKTRAMFAVMDRANKGGDTQLKIVTDLAKAQGIAVENIAGTANELLNAGVRNQRELQQSLQAVTDLQAAGAESTAGALKDLIKRASTARGGFRGMDTWAGTTMFSATELEKAGTNVHDFYAQLSKNVGRTVTQFQVQTGMIRVSSKQMIKALTEAVHTRVGPIAEKAWTLDRIRNSWDATWKDMTSKVDFGPLYNALRGLIAIFDPLSKAGASSQDTLTRVMNGIIKATAWMVTKVTGWILDLQLAFYTFILAVNRKWNDFAKFLNDNMTIVKGALLGITILFAVWLSAILAVAAAFVILWAICLLPIALIIAGFIDMAIAIMYVRKHLEGWKQAAINAAHDLIDGLVAGIRNGIATVTGAVKDLGKGTLDTLKSVLGIHSPSREFAKLGGFAAQGFASGFEAGGDGLSLNMGGKVGGGGKGGGRVELHMPLELNVNGVAKAEEVVPRAIPMLTDALEQILLEWGH